MRLHEWAFGSDESNQQYLAAAVEGQGAVICGRRTYDTSRWGADGPTGSARLPVFVVTHRAPTSSPVGGVYTFVTDGIESALNQARAVVGDKDVCVMGGADLGRQYIAAGRDPPAVPDRPTGRGFAMTPDDLAAHARALLDTNRFLTLGTAGPGPPRATSPHPACGSSTGARRPAPCTRATSPNART